MIWTHNSHSSLIILMHSCVYMHICCLHRRFVDIFPSTVPLITEPDYTTTVTTTANSAELSVSMSSMVSSAYIQGDSFDVVGTVSPDGGCTVVTSDTATYPTALFSDLKSETTYSFALRIASKGSDSTVVGRFSGSFETLAPASEFQSTCQFYLVREHTLLTHFKHLKPRLLQLHECMLTRAACS